MKAGLSGLTADRVPLGVTAIGRTTYTVYGMTVGPNSARAGVRYNFALEGPRGAAFLVTDYGPRYKLNSISCGGGRGRMTCAPRELRGLQRADLASFGVEG